MLCTVVGSQLHVQGGWECLSKPLAAIEIVFRIFVQLILVGRPRGSPQLEHFAALFDRVAGWESKLGIEPALPEHKLDTIPRPWSHWVHSGSLVVSRAISPLSLFNLHARVVRAEP